MDQPGTAEGRCPTCHAWYQQGAALCSVCGTPLTAAPGAGETTVAPQGTLDAATTAAPKDAMAEARLDRAFGSPSQGSRAQREAERLADGGTQKRCSWCGAANAETADACQGCGAAFPRPEQDEALQRASEERIRVANDSIATLRQERERKGLGRLFGR